MIKLFVTISSIIYIICLVISIIKDVRTVRRCAPYGKVFKREFAKIISDIYKAQEISKNEHMPVFTNRITFKIRVDEYKPVGLEYSTIPMYKCYDIYINDELVCKEHIIRECGKDKIWFEFSRQRERDEIITIIKSAYEYAKEILQKNSEELYKRLGLVSKSFFDDSFNNDVEDTKRNLGCNE